ncbi:radical SAM protein [archaeon SCG-AAA382B04]|nr:radical SAM protein [archaeon SCG-AAA382B04]
MSEKRVNGELPKGCKYCERGEKAVYFITGKCDKSCFYCPISQKKKDNASSWINEKKIDKKEDLVEEIEKSRAKGISITGGEPLLDAEKTAKEISFLKKRFGETFHIHLYTSKAIDPDQIKKLSLAGLDEIRYHIPNLEINRKYVNSIKESSKQFEEVGVEIPAIPGKQEEIKKIAQRVEKYIDFMNLNELEYSENSYEKLKEKGFQPKEDKRRAIKDSEKVATSLIKNEFNFTIHFCPSHFKDSVQLKRRFLRRAKNVAKEYEQITTEGTIVKGIIKTHKPKEIIQFLEQKEVPEDLYKKMGDKIETTWIVVDELATKLKEQDEEAEIEIIEQHPTQQRLIVQKIPL